MKKIELLLLVFSLFLVPSCGCGGDIEGIISSGGHFIEEAKVEIASVEKSTLTDSSGYYYFSNLKVGNYLIRVEKEGYYSSYQNICFYFYSRVVEANFELIGLPGDKYEYNDSFLSASIPRTPSLILASIHKNDDEDFYLISWLGRIRISLYEIPGTCNYDIELFNSLYIKIGESHETGNTDEYIDIAEINPREDLFIRVYSVVGSSTTNYRLKAW